MGLIALVISLLALVVTIINLVLITKIRKK